MQPRGANRHAVFFTHAREAISYHYERNPADPRIQHALTLEVDDYGNVLKQAAIGYGRRATDPRPSMTTGTVQQVPIPALAGLASPSDHDQADHYRTLLTYTEKPRTNALRSSADTHRNPLPCEALTFELTGYTPTGTGRPLPGLGPRRARSRCSPGRLRHKFTARSRLRGLRPPATRAAAPIEWLRTLYRRDDLTGLLAARRAAAARLPGESYKLAFTPGLLAQVFQRPRAGPAAEALLPDPASGEAGTRRQQARRLKAGYVASRERRDDHWWIPSGRSFFTTNPADHRRHRADAGAAALLPAAPLPRPLRPGRLRRLRRHTTC